MEVKIAEFGTQLQRNSVALRDEMLRQPLGLEFSEWELNGEADQIHIVACIGETVLGVLLLKHITDSEIKMRQVAVSENIQGIGFGRQMVEFAEKFATTRGYKKMILHARREPVQFYKKLNYDVVGEEFEEIGIPHFKMEKHLVK